MENSYINTIQCNVNWMIDHINNNIDRPEEIDYICLVELINYLKNSNDYVNIDEESFSYMCAQLFSIDFNFCEESPFYLEDFVIDAMYDCNDIDWNSIIDCFKTILKYIY